MKIGIFVADSNGGYPVPAAKGGAVSTLVEHLVRENDEKNLVDMDIISIYDSEAERLSKEYQNINFTWIKPFFLIRWMDSAFFWLYRKLFRKGKAVSYKSLFSLLYYIFKAKNILKKTHYDKVVLENNIPLAWSIKLADYKGEYYYHFHNVPRINAGCKEVFENATAILCVSEFVAKQIQSSANPIGPVKPEKTKVLYNCIDTKHFCRILNAEDAFEMKKRYGIKAGEKVIVFVGRLSEEKGVDKLLEAAIKLNRADMKILIAGGLLYSEDIIDDYQRKLHEMAKILGPRIIFTGYISQSELPVLYSIADVAVLPSMWDEPAGLTMIEAMACGTPVITTNSGGIPEYVGEYGIVLERNDDLVANMSEKINAICEDKIDEESNCTEVEHIRGNFDSGTYLSRFLDCLGC